MADSEPGKMKKENSYTYWVGEKKDLPNGVEKPDMAPKLISEQEKQEYANFFRILKNNIRLLNHKNNSSWNKAGTWERKEFLANDVEKYLNLMLIGKIINNIEISSIVEVDGNASIVSHIGKKKPGYEFKMKLKLKETNFKPGKATLEFREICDYDPEPEVLPLKINISDGHHRS